MDYQRDRNLSYIAFIERINGPTCAERDREFSLLLRETCTLWDDADVTVPISPSRDNNPIPSPFTSSASSFSDDEPEPNPENDSDSDDPDPAEQFLKGVQEHHVVVNGKSYCQEALWVISIDHFFLLNYLQTFTDEPGTSYPSFIYRSPTYPCPAFRRAIFFQL